MHFMTGMDHRTVRANGIKVAGIGCMTCEFPAAIDEARRLKAAHPGLVPRPHGPWLRRAQRFQFSMSTKRRPRKLRTASGALLLAAMSRTLPAEKRP